MTSFQHHKRRPTNAWTSTSTFSLVFLDISHSYFQLPSDSMNRNYSNRLISVAEFLLNFFWISRPSVSSENFSDMQKKMFHRSQANWAFVYTSYHFLSKRNKIPNVKYEASASVSKKSLNTFDSCLGRLAEDYKCSFCAIWHWKCITWTWHGTAA